MKKKLLILAYFAFLFLNLSAGDFYNVHYNSPSLIKNESKYTRIKISAFKTEKEQELIIRILDIRIFRRPYHPCPMYYYIGKTGSYSGE